MCEVLEDGFLSGAISGYSSSLHCGTYSNYMIMSWVGPSCQTKTRSYFGDPTWSATPCSTICTKLAAPRIGMALARIYGKRSNGALHSIGMGYRLEVTTILRYKRRWIDHPTTIILVIFLLLIMNPNGFYSTDAFKYLFSSCNNSSLSFST